MTDTVQPDPDIIDLARAALHYEMHGHHGHAGRMLELLAREHASTGLWTACLAWVDTYAENTPALAAADPESIVRLRFQSAATGERVDTDDTDPSWRWAGRFILARLRDDLEMTTALFDSLVGNPAAGECIPALLQTVALGLTRPGHSPLVPAQQL